MRNRRPEHTPRRSVLRRSFRILLKVFLTLIIIVVIVVILVQTPYVQNIVRGKAEKYLSRKLHTRVNIGGLYVGFPRTIQLKNIYIEDLQKDTLLSAGTIGVDLKMWGLLHNTLDIEKIQVEGLTAKVKRTLPDSTFNFQFIVDAFSSGKEKAPEPKNSTAMKMSLQSLALKNIRVVYKDAVSGNDAEVWIGDSRVHLDAFDLSNPLQGKSGEVVLEKSRVEYRNTINAFYTSLQLGELSTDIRDFDLSKRRFRLKEVRLDSTTTAIRLGKIVPVRQEGVPSAAASSAADSIDGGWHFTTAALRLNGDHFQFDNDNQKPQRAGMDYSHLKITDLSLYADHILYNKDSIVSVITKGRFKERSGFELDELRADILYTNKQARLKGLDLRTPGTHLQRSLAISYTDLQQIMKDPAHTGIDLDLPDSKIQVKDILVFVPSLRSQPVFSNPADTWQVNGRVKGTLSALRIETLQFSGIKDIRLDLSGRLSNPLDAQRVSADLDIRNISGSRTGLVALLPPGTLPANISLPGRMALQGKIKGGMAGVNTDLILRTSSGNLIVKGSLQQFRDPKKVSYDLALQTKALDLGSILKDSLQWGLVTADFTAKGRGFDPQTANAKLHGLIHSAVIRRYDYREFLFDGSIADRHFELTSSIQNTAVSFNLKASGNLVNKFPALRLDWQIDTVDLHALHLVKDTLQFKGHLGADFASTDPDSLEGQLKVSQLLLVMGPQRLHTDSITLLAQRKDGFQDIQLHSEMADLDWNGRYKLTETAQALQHTLNNYYRLNGFKDAAFTAQEWQLQVHFRPSPLVLAYMPSLKGTDSSWAALSFNSERDDLRLVLNAPKIQLGAQSFLNTSVAASTTGSGTPTTSSTPSAPDSSRQLRYRVQIGSGKGSGFALHQTSLQGYLANNKLYTSLLLKDGKEKDRYRVSGQLDKLEDGLKFALNPDSLLLNYDKWLVSRDNFFQYDSAGIVIHDFKISNKDESMQVNSTNPTPNSPIEVAFSNFHLSTLSRFAEQDSLGMEGALNGKAEVKELLSSPIFTSDLKITNLSYRADTIGDLAIKVDNKTANAFAADITLQGNKTDAGLKGMYYTGEGRMALNLDLRQLNLAAIKPFSTSQIQDIKGFLKGSLAINGSLDKPAITGKLHFDSTRITPVISGEPLDLSNDNIDFDADGFNFNQFAMQDSAGNKATIDGNVYTSNYRDYKFDLSLNADNFRLVNSPEASGRLFYGKMNMDAGVNLTGDMNSPRVDGNLKVNKKTDFTFVLPENNPEVVEREGVVRFVDKKNPSDTLVDKAALLARAATRSEIKGMDISLNIETDSNAVFTIVIDERNGDALTARGRSNLVFSMNRSGQMELTGGYELESGTYSLSLSVLKRKFQIERGSTITWTGNPTTANLDITAAYTANTPSIDLIANEIGARTPTEINKFKQKLPFLVTLKMEGELLKPKITFDISLPTDVLSLWPDVDQKLQQIRVQESELDKQVFALLLLNRFVGEDPLQSAAGGGISVSNLAFQSASQILTNQLDRLAGSLIKGVDIHFDLNNQQDFSTGTENDYTELNVSVSKRLFNDRIQVSVGSNFDVQGTGNTNQNASNIAGDAAVDYRLTKDGRYMVRAYRKNQYEAVVEGQVVETGVSFILTFDYNRFREIFGKTKEEKLEERKALKQAGGKTTN